MNDYLIDELPRSWPDLCADALITIDHVDRNLNAWHFSETEAHVKRVLVEPLAAEVQRLARIVAEIAQRAAGDDGFDDLDA